MDKLGAMVMHYVTVNYLDLKPIPISFLLADCDPKSERFQILHRETGQLLRHSRVLNNNFKAILPFKYSQENSLMCVMLDDNAEFNAAILDNVKPMLVDLVTFDPNNPQPYEPPP
ncbi:hypothetical protein [Pseudoalteromonas tetraodonis]|uniref:hypothetical protein n=1 Tax=Pseudoalteromonas tetraodonis TaxID=43659 RepID=UPI003D08F126